jgi:DNA-binding NarL/FixJ family response regulator
MTNPPTPADLATSVVVIDDAEDFRLLLRTALERHGVFRVVAEAADGRQGVEAVKASQPDLVLLDIAMPVMDGLQALTLIRDECPTAIVVMLSAFGESSGLRERALSMGANGYIQKGGHLRALPEQLRVMVAAVTAERAAQTRPRLRPAP